MNHEDALNIILSHNCPNGAHFVSGEEEDRGIQGWEFEGHCHIVRIKACLAEENPNHPDPAKRFRYEIVDLQVKDGGEGLGDANKASKQSEFNADHFLDVNGR